MVLLRTLRSTYKASSRPIMIMPRLRFDETPTKLRLLNPSSADVASTVCSDEVSCKESSSLHTKVMQTEYSIGVLTFDEMKKQYNFLYGEMPVFLRAVESTNAQNTLRCLKDAIHSVPGIVDYAFNEDFRFCILHCCADSYAANFSAERKLSEDMWSWVSANTVCDIHRLYTATKTSMSMVEYDVSGLLNLSLTMNEAGAVARLHQILASIFAKRLIIYFEKPPVENVGSIEATYRDELFELFLPIVGVDSARARMNRKRRYILKYFLNGCLFSKEVAHYCPWSCCRNYTQTLKYFISHVCWALIPFKCHKFPRSRWTNWDKSIEWAGLLEGCHGLLSDVMSEFLGKKFKTLELAETSILQALPSAVNDWDVAYSESVQDRPLQGPSTSGKESFAV